MPRRLRMAAIGLGQGAAAVLPSLATMPEIEFIGGTDINPRMRRGMLERYPGTRAYESVTALCEDPEIEAVWIATPNRFHCEHAVEAMRNGKHVAVEKPMAISLDEADRMVQASEKYGVALLAGHTSSYSISIRAMRKIAQSGVIGRPRAIVNWSYTDWMLRPRTADELDPAQGGGIVMRQTPHQIDTLRLLGGGQLRSLRASTGQWMDERPIPGFYSAHLEFENGLTATILHNGYGYFMTLELYPWAQGAWRYSDRDRIELRQRLRRGGRDEEREKQAFRIGGDRDPTKSPVSASDSGWSPIDLGMLVLSCERGDIRHSRYGLSVYADDGRHEIDLRELASEGLDLENGVTLPALMELYDAVVRGKPVVHSGAWGRATLEASLAVLDSARERREVMLSRQVALPDDYDALLHIPFGAPTIAP
jgi:phthalate 4,5-cis-dihydrodiol dehydrogenase